MSAPDLIGRDLVRLGRLAARYSLAEDAHDVARERYTRALEELNAADEARSEAARGAREARNDLLHYAATGGGNE